jgi:signal recognition particle subunit SRP54
MVLGELGSKISEAWRKVSSSRQVDETVLNEMLQEMTTALLSADVDVDLTNKFRESVRSKVNLENLAAGLNKRKVIQKVQNATTNVPFAFC